jgi:hypothetical protein
VSTTAVAPKNRYLSRRAPRPDRAHVAWLRTVCRSPRLPWAVLVASLAAFGYGATTIESSEPSQFGLLAAASPAYVVSILLAVLMFGISIRQRSATAATAAIVLGIVCQRLPRAISTDVPMYAWTYKHLGVVDYIQQSKSLARGVDIYNSWPGLFAVTAWFSDLTGVPPISIAHWFTPLFHLAVAGLMYAAARAWRLTPAQAQTASFLVVTLNWVEQDYYAPQAIAVILTLALLILIGLSRDRPVGTVLTLVVFAALTITHQLTPYWVFLAAGLLVVGRKLKPWWILIPMAAILIGFFFYNFDITHEYTLFSGNVVDNATTNNTYEGVIGQIFTSTVMRLLSASMWLGAVIVLASRCLRRRPFWALAALALSPLLILGGQGYGGEAVFRVFLYSLPGCALVLAPLAVAGLRAGDRRFALSLVLVLVVAAASAQAYFGSWQTNLLSRAQVAAADELLTGGDYPAYVTPLTPVWPERSDAKYVDYARFNERYDHSMAFQQRLIGMSFDTDADYETFMSLIDRRSDASTYVVLTEPMALYAAYFGMFPINTVPNLRERIRDDPRWEVVEDESDVGVYLHRVPVG